MFEELRKREGRLERLHGGDVKLAKQENGPGQPWGVYRVHCVRWILMHAMACEILIADLGYNM